MRALLSIPALSFLFTIAAQEPAAPAAPCCNDKAATKEGEAKSCCCCADAQDPKKDAKLDAKVWDHFGDGIVEGPATELAEVMKNPEQFTGKTVRVSAAINSVCQKKGCWMGLGKVDAAGKPQLFVQFKDYGFFMPKEATGRTAIVEGTMTMKQETVEQTKHYLEDAGKAAEAANVTEGRKLWQFMASGVALKKRLDEQVWDHFGDGIAPGEATELAEVMKNPEQFMGKTVRVSAPINSVCQKKGCWMGLGQVDAAGKPQLFVQFKDYGFFMPKDATGRTAIVEGTMTMKQETVAQTKHYLEDAGKAEEAAKVTEGRKLWSFMASGVALKKTGS